jgi:rod shape-determining protein MreD
MIRRFFPAGFVFLLLVFQVFFHSLSGMTETLPDLVPIALTIVAVRRGMGWAAMVGFLAGVFEDSFATSHLGLNALAWTFAGSVGGAMRGSLYGNRVALSVILAGGLKLIHDIIYSVIYLRGAPADIASRLLIHGPLAAAYSAGLALVIFILLDRLLLVPRD